MAIAKDTGERGLEEFGVLLQRHLVSYVFTGGVNGLQRMRNMGDILGEPFGGVPFSSEIVVVYIAEQRSILPATLHKLEKLSVSKADI
jgi:hypothetical protein